MGQFELAGSKFALVVPAVGGGADECGVRGEADDVRQEPSCADLPVDRYSEVDLVVALEVRFDFLVVLPDEVGEPEDSPSPTP